jgi:hypothetical protein
MCQSTEIFLNQIISQKSIYSLHLVTRLCRIILVLMLSLNYSRILGIEICNWTKTIHCIKNGRDLITGTWTHCVISGRQEEKKRGEFTARQITSEPHQRAHQIRRSCPQVYSNQRNEHNTNNIFRCVFVNSSREQAIRMEIYSESI